MALRVLVRGVGDIGAAVAHRLFLAGHVVVVHDGEQTDDHEEGEDEILVSKRELESPPGRE